MSRFAPLLSVNPLSIVPSPDETEWRNIFFAVVLSMLLKITNSILMWHGLPVVIIRRKDGSILCDQDLATLPNIEDLIFVPLRYEEFTMKDRNHGYHGINGH